MSMTHEDQLLLQKMQLVEKLNGGHFDETEWKKLIADFKYHGRMCAAGDMKDRMDNYKRDWGESATNPQQNSEPIGV